MAEPNKHNPYETVVLDREPEVPPGGAPDTPSEETAERAGRGRRFLAFALGGALVVVLSGGLAIWQLLGAPAATQGRPAAQALPTTILPTAAPPATAPAVAAETAQPAAQHATAALALAAAPAIPAARAITLGAVGDEWMFDPTQLQVAQDETIALTFVNASRQQHNWVLVRGGDEVAARVNAAGALADAASGYLPADRADVVASIGLVRGGAATVTFAAPEAGTYTYLCTVPGHYDTGMSGTLVVSSQ